MRILGLTTIVLAAGLAFAAPAGAQNTASPAPATEIAAPAGDNSAVANTATPADPLTNADGSPRFGPVAGIGQPIQGAYGLQHQVSPTGREAAWFHNAILFPLIVVISLFVLALLLWVMVRYRRNANPVPSRTSHNTLIEIIWTLVPVLILIGIAVPSIKLLAAQFKPAPDGAVTLKAIGHQWYWTYEYPDHGGIEITANMLRDRPKPGETAEPLGPGERWRTDTDGPPLLATDNRIVLPVGVPIRLITTSTDVIHSWALPAAWVKIDAVPGRLNEISFTIEEPGIYYGQCSELCGARHGYMPITVEAVSPEVFAQWVAAKGGTMPGTAAPGNDSAPAATPPANDAGPADNATANEAAPANASAGSH